MRALLTVCLVAGVAAAAEPPLPDGALARFGSGRFRVVGGAYEMAASADGKLLAAAGGDGVTVFEAATGRTLSRFKPNDGTQSLSGPMAFTDAGKLLALGVRFDTGDSVTFRIDPATGVLERTTAMSGEANNGVYSPDGTLFAADNGDKVVIYDAETGKKRSTIKPGTDGGFQALAFAPSSRRLVVGTNTGAVVFDRESGGRVGAVKIEGGVGLVAFDRAGTVAFVAPLNGKLFLRIDLATGRAGKPVTLGENFSGIESLGVSAAGEVVLKSQGDGGDRVTIHDPATGAKKRSIDRLPYSMRAFPVAAGRQFALLGFGDGVSLFDLATGAKLPQSAEFSTMTNAMRMPHAGRVCVEADDGWYTFDPAAGGPAKRYGPRFIGSATAKILSPSGRLVGGNSYGRYAVTDTLTGREVYSAFPPQGQSAYGDSAAISADDRTLLITNETHVELHELPRRRLRLRFPVSDKPTDFRALLTPDGGTVVVLNTAGDRPTPALQLYSAATGKPTHAVPVPGSFSDLGFSADGSRIAVTAHLQANDSEMPVEFTAIETRTGVVTHRQSFTGALEGLGTTITPDGRCFVGGDSESRSVRLVEIATGKERLARVHSADAMPNHVAFDPTGRRMATFGGAVPGLVWDARPAVPAATPADADRLWAELASADAAVAFRAVRSLEAAPAVAVPLLTAKLPAAAAVDPKRLAKWLADLDAPAYRDRETARRQLAAVADRCRPEMEALRAKTASAQVRSTLGDLLDRAAAATADDLRTLRAVEVLEYTPGPAAADQLRTWAAGTPAALLTTEATRALARRR